MTRLNRISATMALLGCAFGPAAATAEGTLNVLSWEGYTDPSFIPEFEKTSGCKVNATYVGSNDDFAPKLMAGGGVYDVIAPSVDTTRLMIDLDLVEPLDLDRIPAWKDIYPQFTSLDAIQKDKVVYGVPYAWGAILLMYQPKAFPGKKPDSIADLWDPALKGKVSIWDDKSSIYLAARKNGDMNIYDLTDEQIEKAKAALIAQKPLVRKYWATAGELADLFKAGEVVLANTWAGNQSSILKREGIDVVEFIPKEGGEGWVDAWMIVKDTPNRECAYDFINMQLSTLGQCGVANINAYSVANPVAAKACMTPEQFVTFHQDDPSFLDHLLLWQPLGDRFEAYANAWNAVKAQ
jgi:spermidine/putrescine-binding protein